MQFIAKKTFECAKHAQAHLIVQIKTNQESLYNQTVNGCKISKPIACYEDGWSKQHGRLEKRVYDVFNPEVFLQKWPEWGEVKRIIRVTRFRQLAPASEIVTPHYFHYASHACLKAEVFGKAIREHWWCENKSHYIRDTAFAEDNTTKRIGAFESVLLSISLNIIRITKFNNIRGKLFENSVSFAHSVNYINLFVG